MRTEIVKFADELGSNSELVQAAGGNISWKQGNELWIKASGCWLADAQNRDIFTGVDIKKALVLIHEGESVFAPALLNNKALRPSIETSLHILLPQKVVAHLHSVNAIAYSCLPTAQTTLKKLLNGMSWSWVDYAQPGAPLAEAVQAVIKPLQIKPEILILQNHGLVVAGDSVLRVRELLADVQTRLNIVPRPLANSTNHAATQTFEVEAFELVRSEDEFVLNLAFDPESFEIAAKRWVLYPDHAVFLGTLSPACAAVSELNSMLKRRTNGARLAIIRDKGVYVDRTASATEIAMLRCYADVAARLPSDLREINILTDSQAHALVDWEAEKYRRNLER